ncbi:MAG: carbohydrate ABC transporter permease [Oscillospiraceae bacterium]|nr:carbohydrate ABC transporter permease [Oscillospiraceae bacterium]MBR3083960.1 carbohydrate ABC transporter permease [Oscillospiraceae bacterium]MBR6095465.1 carbohydrate ABC transporter permease [Oscillospiraceae bacterium]
MTENERAARRKKIAHALMWALLLVLFICFIFPFLMVIINVFKDKSDITRDPLSLIGATKGFILTNFPEAMKKMNFWNVFANSLIVTVCATVLTILVSAMTAFVIVRNGKWKFCTLMFSLMIASMVIPFQVLMVPLVSVYGGTLGVLNHRITLILMHVGFSVSMAMFMFHGSIKTNIPLELEEAATIDGCSRWQTFWKVVFPLLKPTVATVAIINAMAYWNDYLLPSLVLTKKDLYTIPIATQAFYGTYSTDIGLVMAALLLAMLPILILYVFLQRYIVQGVTAGAVKG